MREPHMQSSQLHRSHVHSISSTECPLLVLNTIFVVPSARLSARTPTIEICCSASVDWSV